MRVAKTRNALVSGKLKTEHRLPPHLSHGVWWHLSAAYDLPVSRDTTLKSSEYNLLLIPRTQYVA